MSKRFASEVTQVLLRIVRSGGKPTAGAYETTGGVGEEGKALHRNVMAELHSALG